MSVMRLRLKILFGAILLFVAAEAFAQGGFKVSGTVKDEYGEPVTGVSVICEANKKGAITDAKGYYEVLAASESAKLVYSFMGYKTQEVQVRKRAVINVVLEEDAETLEEAVISVGYGLSQKREDLVGSAFQVTTEQLKYKPAERMDNLLVGLVPGLSVIEESTNGRPSVKLRIRGDGSLSASNEPLWIIDGVPVYNSGTSSSISGTGTTLSPISLMNPDDIESMTVLKDASTVALYGADGSNGVILVTTRKATSGKLSLNASIRYGYSDIDPQTRVKFLGAEDWMALAKEGWVNSGRDIKNFPYQDNEYQTYTGVDTNWYPYYQTSGSTMQVNFSASGGSEKLNSLVSGGYYYLKSPYIGNDTKRFTFRNNTTLKLSKKFTANFIIDASYTRNKVFSSYGSFHEILPIFTPYNDDGTYRWYNYYSTSDTEYDVVAKKFWTYLDSRDLDSHFANSLQAKGSLTLTYKPTDYLSITSQSAATFMNIYEARYSSKYTLSGMNTEDSSKAGSSTRYGVFDYDYFEKIHANFDKTFGGKHKVSAMLGWEWRGVTHPSLSATGYGFVNDNIQEVSYSTYPDLRRGTSTVSYRKNLSYIASVSYGYDKRYNISANYRRQGNSAFSEFSKWSDFASIGAGWNVHREKWFRPGFFNSISLKATFGTAGNSRVDTSTSYGAYSLSNSYYYGTNPGAVQTSTPNPALHWERTFKTDVQLQLGFLDRFHLTIEPYRELTTDVLYKARVSSIVDDSGVYQNIGEISNNGIEFIFESVNIKKQDFSWSTSINGARNRNMIEKLYGDSYKGLFDTIWIEGQSKDAYWLVRWAGVDPVTGAPMWYDKNGDLTYKFSYEDRVFLPYSKQPDLYGGVSNDFTWKNFNLRVMFDYTIGGWYYEYVFRDDGYSVIDENQVPEALDHWTTPGEGNLNPAFIYKGWTNSYYNSTRCLYNMTSIQLRSVSLSYTLPRNISKKAGIETCTFSLIGNNLYFWSPAQSRTKNSYKTMRFGNQGMRREFSFQVSLNF